MEQSVNHPNNKAISNEQEASPEFDDVQRSLELVISVYKDFRAELMESYGTIDFTLKPDNSQLTELDIKVETTLKARLQQEFPYYGFQGEETGKNGDSEKFWLVDPIDGTISFIRGLPNCTNMAALIIERQPVAAVIYNFAEDELYTAIKGQGAFKNGQPIHVSAREINNSYIDNWNSTLYNDVYTLVKPYGIRTLQSIGASGRSFSLIAEGKLDGGILIDGPAAAHDRAPGALLIQEAGGEIVSFEPGDWSIDTENYVIANPQLATFFRGMQKSQRYPIIDRSSSRR